MMITAFALGTASGALGLLGPSPAAASSFDRTVPRGDAGAAGPAPTRAGLGTVSPTYQSDRSCPAQFTCATYTVDVPGVAAPEGFTVAIAQPTAPEVATVALLSGGYGTTWWASGRDALSTDLVKQLRAEGMRLVQVRWHVGWSVAPAGDRAGPVALAARPATVLRYIAGTISPARHIVVAGQSGGAAQLAYSLGFYGLDSVVTGALFTSGPPLGAIDKGCAANPGEEDFWYESDAAALIDSAWGFSANGPCATHDLSYVSQWQANSVEAAPDLVWPATRVQFVIGADDFTSAPAHAAAFMDALPAGSYTSQVVPRTRHDILTSKAGVSAVTSALEVAVQ